jgi:hypothetical protein
MFAPDGIPNRPPARLYRASSSRLSSGGAIGATGVSGRSGGNRRASSSSVGGTEKKGRSPLGTLAKSASTSKNGGSGKGFGKRTVIHTGKKERKPEDEKRGRLRRFALQSVSRSILRGEKKADGKAMFRVGSCQRAIVPVAKAVGLQYVPVTKSAHYKNLQQCGSVWTCPCCSAKIAERRRDELARLIEKHLKACGSVYMVTHTTAHNRYDDLGVLLSRFILAQGKMKGHRQFKKLHEDFGIIGSVKALEVTWSPLNGWHVHSHTLLFSEQKEIDVDRYEEVARPLWKMYALKQGLTMNEHGFKMDRTFGAVQDYILKFGHDPATDKVWGVESEMAKNHAKQGRMTDHFTPFGMLAEIYDYDREDLKPVFREYALCFKGRRQLEYSRGLKARYQEEEKEDEELVLESQENEAITLVELGKSQWEKVVGNDVRGELLEAVRTGCVGVVLKFLAGFGIEVEPAPLSGLRVQTPKGVGVISLVVKCPILCRWRCSVILEGDGVDRWRAFDLTEVVILKKERVASQ